MAKVKVWNKNSLPHVETFKGDKIEIPAGGCIEMDWEDATEFKGQFFPMVINADGTHNPKGFKKIVVDRPSEPIFKDMPLINHADGKVATSRAELEAALAKFDHMKVKDDSDTAPRSSEIDVLKAQVAALTKLVEGQVDRKKPGPKPKAVRSAAG